MARYIQTNIPSPAKIFSFTLNNFVGGLNNREHIIEENQCASVMNMAFTPDGVMEKRKGTTWFDNLTLDKPITFIDEFKPNKEQSVIIRATTEKAYIGGALLRNLGGQMYGVNYEGHYLFCDSTGLFSYGRFDETAGTYVKIIGTQTTDYVLMEIVSPPSGYVPLDNTHTKGVRVIDFTNRKVWYEPCKNEIEDTFKQGNVVPPKPRFIVMREGRLYIAGSDDNDDTVYISDTGNPYYFPASVSMQVPPNSDRVSGLAVYNNAVIVGRRMDIHAITGDTNRTDAGLPVFRLVKLNTHFGFANQRSIVNAHNYLFFLGTDSQFYALRTLDTSSDMLQTSVISKTVNIHGAPISVNKDDIWYASGAFFDDCYYVSVGDKILVYNYLHQVWTVYDQINATSFYPLLNVLLMGTKNGKIVMRSDDYLDNGKPYKAYWKSRFFDMGDATAFKMFRDFFIVSKTTKGIPSSIKLLFEVDYADTTSEVDVGNYYSIWGKSKFGDTYINRDINSSSPFLIYQRGRQIRITFSNGENISKYLTSVEELPLVENIYEGMLVDVSGVLYQHKNLDWVIVDANEFNEGMCVLQLSGEYEFKWKR